jgi:hypothetical protein
VQTSFTSLTQHVLIPKESYELILEYAETHQDHRTYIPDVEFTDYNASFAVMNKFVEDAISSMDKRNFTDEQISIATQKFVCESDKLWPLQEVYHNRILKYMEEAYRVPERAQMARDKLMIEHANHADAITYMYKKYLEQYASRVMNDMNYISNYTSGIAVPMQEGMFEMDFKDGYYMAEDLGNQILAIPGMIIKLIKKLLNGLSFSLSEAGRAFASRVLSNGQINEAVIKQLYDLYVAKNKTGSQQPIRYPNPQRVNELRQAYSTGFDAFVQQINQAIDAKNFKTVDQGVIRMVQGFQVVTQNDSLPRGASFQEFRTAILSIANNVLLMDGFMKALVAIDDKLTSAYGVDPKQALAEINSDMGKTTGLLDRDKVDRNFQKSMEYRKRAGYTYPGQNTNASAIDDFGFEDFGQMFEDDPPARTKEVVEAELAKKQKEHQEKFKNSDYTADIQKLQKEYDELSKTPNSDKIKGTMQKAVDQAADTFEKEVPNLIGSIIKKILEMIGSQIGNNVGSFVTGLLPNFGAESVEYDLFLEQTIEELEAQIASGRLNAKDRADAEQTLASMKAKAAAAYKSQSDLYKRGEELAKKSNRTPAEEAEYQQILAQEKSAQGGGTQTVDQPAPAPTDGQAAVVEQPAAPAQETSGEGTDDDKNVWQIITTKVTGFFAFNADGAANADMANESKLKEFLKNFKLETLVGSAHKAVEDVVAGFIRNLANITGDYTKQDQSDNKSQAPNDQQAAPGNNVGKPQQASVDFEYEDFMTEAGGSVAKTVNDAVEAGAGAVANGAKAVGGAINTAWHAFRGGMEIRKVTKTLGSIFGKGDKNSESSQIIAQITSMTVSITGRIGLVKDLGLLHKYIEMEKKAAGSGEKAFRSDEKLVGHLTRLTGIIIGVTAITLMKFGIFKNPLDIFKRDSSNLKKGALPPAQRASTNIANTREAVGTLSTELWNKADQAVKNLWTYINGWLYGGLRIKGSRERTVGIGRIIKDELESLAPYVNMQNVIRIELPDDNPTGRRR